MSDAKVTFEDIGYEPAAPGQEVRFDFNCPKHARRCGGIIIAGRIPGLKRDGQNQNGGVAMWDWDGNRETPTFSPSINCGRCWHGYIENGRCVTAQKVEEPELPGRP